MKAMGIGIGFIVLMVGIFVIEYIDSHDTTVMQAPKIIVYAMYTITIVGIFCGIILCFTE